MTAVARTMLGLVVVSVLVAGCGGSSPQSESHSFTMPSLTLPTAAGLTETQKDDGFITALGSSGLDQARDIKITAGKRACGAFAEGSSVGDIRDILIQKGFTAQAATRIILAAVATYCPEYKDRAAG